HNSFDFLLFVASQLSQSSYMALQLPYVVIGLGTTPNFVEHLFVSILTPFGDPNVVAVRKEWTQIIPNSQLVISPYPRQTPYYWKMQLFITPSNNILKTAISLASTMFLLIILIALLQLREKVRKYRANHTVF